MPLFMDYHKGLSLTVDDVKKAHIADEAIQSKYGVIYHQFWVNEHDGAVFCLMEGPNKEACAAVHREAHGAIACSIVEVAEGFCKVLMGSDHLLDHGHVRHRDGTPDLGIRSILLLHIHGVTTVRRSSDYKSLKPPTGARELALSILSKFGGRQANTLHDDSIVAVFDSQVSALKCALELQEQLLQRRTGRDNDEWNIVFKMGLSAGQPLREHGDIFSETISLAKRLCNVANANELVISAGIQHFCNVSDVVRDVNVVRVLSPRDEDFIFSLFSISEEKISDERFNVDTLSRNIGMSRPQLYRKVISLTGKSPNDFLRDLRMDKALDLLRKKAGNISEIALEVGYSNPSYFARCFQMRYGCTPSRFN